MAKVKAKTNALKARTNPLKGETPHSLASAPHYDGSLEVVTIKSGPNKGQTKIKKPVYKKGDTVKIINLFDSDPAYMNREGKITEVADFNRLIGTWGNVELFPAIDSFIVYRDGKILGVWN